MPPAMERCGRQSLRSVTTQLIVWVLLAVASGSVQADLRLASWNIQHLGWDNDKSYEAVARISARFDFVAIQELMNADALGRLVDALERKTGEDWESLNSAPLGETSYREKSAFIWREDAVEYLGGALTYIDDRDRFAREPFSARFQVVESSRTFVAATIHIVYGDTLSDRTPEIRALRHYWDWLAEVYPEYADNRILFGDFNLRPGHDAWEPMREVAEPLITDGATTLSTNDREFANLYDNILVPLDHDLPITTVGIEDFPVLLTETTPHYWSHEKARAHVSDHAPVYAILGDAELYPPRQGELRVPNRVSTDGEPPPEPECVGINEASVDELERLPHVGPARAEDIADGRPWASVERLREISGIGEGRLKEIADSDIVCKG